MTAPHDFVRAIHDSRIAMVLCVTGGGSLAISQLLTVPGASRSVLEAAVPYSAEALEAWLGAKPESFCSAETARRMAMAAFVRARRYLGDKPSDRAPLGVACTASLASDRPKRGEHRFHVATQTESTTSTFSLVLDKDARTRLEEELLCASSVLNAIALAAGLNESTSTWVRAEEKFETRYTRATEALQALVMHNGPPVPHGAAQAGRIALFPGSFHPLHEGHRRMAEVARRKLRRDVCFEISVRNVDKPPLDYTEIEDRLQQFPPETSGVWLTSAPTFAEKAQLFPGAVFLVGYDTIIRIGKSRYYGASPAARDAALQAIGDHGCRFLVFGRQTGEGFQSLANADLPPALQALCDEVPESEFREDVSSTELRQMELPGG